MYKGGIGYQGRFGLLRNSTRVVGSIHFFAASINHNDRELLVSFLPDCLPFFLSAAMATQKSHHHDSMLEKAEAVEIEKIAVMDAGHLDTHANDLDEDARKLEKKAT